MNLNRRPGIKDTENHLEGGIQDWPFLPSLSGLVSFRAVPTDESDFFSRGLIRQSLDFDSQFLGRHLDRVSN